MAKRAKIDGPAFNPVADCLVRAVTSPQPRIVIGYRGESEGQEPLNREKRVLLTPSEKREINSFLLEVGAVLGTEVQLSHLLRASIELLKHARVAPGRRTSIASPWRRSSGAWPACSSQPSGELPP
jgi:hypothetical protein